jgi:hypothetical protein
MKMGLAQNVTVILEWLGRLMSCKKRQDLGRETAFAYCAHNFAAYMRVDVGKR